MGKDMEALEAIRQSMEVQQLSNKIKSLDEDIKSAEELEPMYGGYYGGCNEGRWVAFSESLQKEVVRLHLIELRQERERLIQKLANL